MGTFTSLSRRAPVACCTVAVLAILAVIIGVLAALIVPNVLDRADDARADRRLRGRGPRADRHHAAGEDAHALARRAVSLPGALAKVVAATGQAGDIVLLHPFMLHARSPNTGSSVRFLCNPCVQLHEPMNLARANSADYSPVEQAIIRATAVTARSAPAGP